MILQNKNCRVYLRVIYAVIFACKFMLFWAVVIGSVGRAVGSDVGPGFYVKNYFAGLIL